MLRPQVSAKALREPVQLLWRWSTATAPGNCSTSSLCKCQPGESCNKSHYNLKTLCLWLLEGNYKEKLASLYNIKIHRWHICLSCNWYRYFISELLYKYWATRMTTWKHEMCADPGPQNRLLVDFQNVINCCTVSALSQIRDYFGLISFKFSTLIPFCIAWTNSSTKIIQ